MRAHLALAACAALATMSPSNDKGGPDLLSGQGGNPDPAQAEADAKAAAEAAAAQVEADAKAAAEAAAAKAAKPAKPAKAVKASPSPAPAAPASATTAPAEDAPASHTAMIWVQPGHERFAIGELTWATDADAEGLRAAGRAREATSEELKARVG